MTLNFPADPGAQSPVNTYGPDSTPLSTDNGVLYTWDGDKWVANKQISYDGRYVNVTGDTMTGDLTVPSLNGGQLAGFRNQLINGDFRVWQRGISNTANGIRYVADRWNAQTSASAGINRQTAPQDLPCPFVMQFATDGQGFRQGIELFQNNAGDGLNGPFIPGSTWTISFYCNKDVSAIAPVIAFRSVVYDTAGEVRVDDSPPNWSAVGSAISGFQRYKCTITIGAGKIPANGHNQLAVVFIPSSVNMEADTRVTGCQFEPGPVATPFEHRPIGTELALCQRYFQALQVRRINAETSWYTMPTKMRDRPIGSAEVGTVYDDSFGITAGTAGRVDITLDAEL